MLTSVGSVKCQNLGHLLP